jgi:hypothetical protein
VQENKSITSLDLCNNDIGVEGAIYLSEALKAGILIDFVHVFTPI